MHPMSRPLAITALVAAGLALQGCLSLGDIARPGGLTFRGCPAEFARVEGVTYGTLSPRGCTGRDGRVVDYYAIDIDRPGEFEIRLGSEDFDAYVLLYDERGALIDRDDDITPILNTDAKMTLRLRRGRYFIGATHRDDDFGRYRIDVRYRGR